MKFSKAQSVAVSAFRHVQRFGRVMLGVSVLAFLATFLTSVHSRPASATAPGSSVTIANTPLPVTGNVNATVSGTVGISGTPNVAISNTPSVSLSGTPTVNLASSTGPLPVTGAGDPAASGFTPVWGFIGGDFTSGVCTATFINPASTGQILVVENVGAVALKPTGQKVQSMSINGTTGGPSMYFWFPTYQVDDGTTAVFGAEQAMRLYYKAGQNFSVYINQTSTSTDAGQCGMSYTGYLVNVH